MKKLLLCLLVVLFVCCQDYKKDIVGWWASERATPQNYVYYIIRDDGTYKKRMKTNVFGANIDGTDRGTWEIDGSDIIFNVETYNHKEQRGREERFKIRLLTDEKLILETRGGENFSYISADNVNY